MIHTPTEIIMNLFLTRLMPENEKLFFTKKRPRVIGIKIIVIIREKIIKEAAEPKL